MRQQSRTAAAVFGLAGLIAAGVVGHRLGAAAAPDVLLASAYNTALAGSETSWSATPPNIWLSGYSTGAQPPGRELQIGDIITIAGKGGHPAAIKVTALEHVGGERLGIPGVRFQLVTGDAHASGPEAARQVRFLFSTAPADQPPLPAKPDRVL